MKKGQWVEPCSKSVIRAIAKYYKHETRPPLVSHFNQIGEDKLRQIVICISNGATEKLFVLQKPAEEYELNA